MSAPKIFEIFDTKFIEATDLKPGDHVRILIDEKYHYQGYCRGNPQGKAFTVLGVNYEQHWVYGDVDDGGEIGLSTYFVERVTP